jgi:hypothetical protein
VPQGLWDCLGEPSEGFAITVLPGDQDRYRGECIDRARADLVPAGPDLIDQAIVALAGQRMKASEGINAAALEAAYHIGLDDVPADLLAKAVRMWIKTSPFRPMAADLRNSILPELEARIRRAKRLGAL